jgi:hypothetical protein
LAAAGEGAGDPRRQGHVQSDQIIALASLTLIGG